MPRPKRFDDDYYNDAAVMAANAMRGKGYSKEAMLVLAGFESDQKQHWSKLRRGFACIGVHLCWTHGVGWHQGAAGQDGNMTELCDKLTRNTARGMRTEIVAAIQSGESADATVASLMQQGKNPILLASVLRHIGMALPVPCEAQLNASVLRLLPDAPAAVRQQITSAIEGITEQARLLGSPSG